MDKKVYTFKNHINFSNDFGNNQNFYDGEDYGNWGQCGCDRERRKCNTRCNFGCNNFCDFPPRDNCHMKRPPFPPCEKPCPFFSENNCPEPCPSFCPPPCPPFPNWCCKEDTTRAFLIGYLFGSWR